ncbi:hypothetical protein FOCC_FOCC009047 [Frankliniella occidentalis]|nr:hypothetical protein FOCC_FOCC009047 [Frankliniella occidentalis]
MNNRINKSMKRLFPWLDFCCFKELNAELVGELLAALKGDDTLLLHVALVAYKHDLGVVPRVRLDLRHPVEQRKTEIRSEAQSLPVLHAVERLLIGDVVHEDEAHGASVVRRGDGRTHDSSYWLFREGEMASAGLQVFAEKGHSDGLEAADHAGVYDEFTAPPVPRGVGRTVADFFLDGNHSMVSVAVRVVPSPDWFIGVDSLDLCRGNHWIDSIAIEVVLPEVLKLNQL